MKYEVRLIVPLMLDFVDVRTFGKIVKQKPMMTSARGGCRCIIWWFDESGAAYDAVTQLARAGYKADLKEITHPYRVDDA